MHTHATAANFIAVMLVWRGFVEQWKPKNGNADNPPIGQIHFHQLISKLHAVGQGSRGLVGRSEFQFWFRWKFTQRLFSVFYTGRPKRDGNY